MKRWWAGIGAGIAGALLVAACGSSGSSSATSSSTGGSKRVSAAAVHKLGVAYDAVTASSVTLQGAGANSIDPFFERVFYDYHLLNFKTTVTYDPAGSSVGATDIEKNTVAFGDSEVPLSSKDLAKAEGGTILQIPVDLGGVAISYNLPGVPSGLKLDGPTLAAIFDGSITRWNDPRIAAVTGDSRLPDLKIVAVHRADSSGPGYDVDAYLLKTSSAWASKAGTAKPSKTWPVPGVGVGEQLNTGVATYIHQTPGAIGYVEYGYALQARFTDAALKNQAGSFVAPSLASIRAAGAQAAGLSASHFSIIDEPGAVTYPLANFSWTLVYQSQRSEATGIALGKLIDYVVTTGQARAGALGYAPLPPNAVALAEQTLHQMTTSGGGALFAS
jgi:phosphate transport system substrate-binding protein